MDAVGLVRSLAILRRERVAALPDVLTMAETGLANMEANKWNLLLAPAGTPQPVVDHLAGALQIEQFVQAKIARWQEVIKAAGICAD